MRTRVLHIVQNLNYGGMERLIAELAHRTDPERFDMHVLALEYFGRFAEGLSGIATLHTGPHMSRWSLLRPDALARAIRGIAPDVVHSHSGVWYKAGLAARMAGVRRIIHTEHGRVHPDLPVNRVVDYIAAWRTDVVVAVSTALGDYLRRRVVPRSTAIAIVPNGVDTTQYCPRADHGELRRELGIPVERPILGSIGRLEPVKGYDIMVDALARLRDHWPHERPFPLLALAGDGSERPALSAQAASLGLSEHVRFLGWRDDMSALHSAFRVFTMSSRSEGTSISLLEAMSAGLCPIVTDVGGNAEVLGPLLSHRLVAPGSPDAMAAEWYHAVIDAPARIAVDGGNARQRVIDAYDINNTVRRYEALYVGGTAADARPSKHSRGVPALAAAHRGPASRVSTRRNICL